MGKRRTKKEKLTAKHRSQALLGTLVKRQSVIVPAGTQSKNTFTKQAEILDKDDNLASIKKDIFKSLILACLILGVEMVLYLAWKIE